MLKTIALAGIFVFTSAVSTVATTSTKPVPQSSQSAPSSPRPQGWCWPAGAC
jgi:hypothetical protein